MHIPIVGPTADGVGIRPRKCRSYIGCPLFRFVRTRRHVEAIHVGILWKATAGGREAAHFPNVLPMEICSIVWFLAFMQFSFVCCSNLTPAAASRGGGLLGALNSASGRCLDEIMFLQVRSAKAGTQHDAGARLLSICPITLIRRAVVLPFDRAPLGACGATSRQVSSTAAAAAAASVVIATAAVAADTVATNTCGGLTVLSPWS